MAFICYSSVGIGEVASGGRTVWYIDSTKYRRARLLMRCVGGYLRLIHSVGDLSLERATRLLLLLLLAQRAAQRRRPRPVLLWLPRWAGGLVVKTRKRMMWGD
jgi:hypothetical protein